MNFKNPRYASGRYLGLVLSLVFSSSAFAGPGFQYWKSLNKTPAPSIAPAKHETAPKPVVCSDSHEVAVTIMKPAWANGRGPLQAVQIGAKRECHVCAGTTTVMRPAMSNGRGALQPVQIRGTHDCTPACRRPTQL